MKNSNKTISLLTLPAALWFAGTAATHAQLTTNRYWDPLSSGGFGSISTAVITWSSPLDRIWTNSNSGGSTRLANYSTTLNDICNWGGPSSALGGGTVPVGTVNAGWLYFNTISGSGTVTLSGGTITLNATAKIYAQTASQTHTISSTLAGAATSLTKEGPGTIVLSGSNTFAGPTTISAGTLTLGNSNALANSPLDTAASVLGDPTNGLKATVTSLAFGGLSGNKDLAAVFTTTSGGFGSVTGLTLNPGSAVTTSYTGAIADGATGMALTKNGLGTQVLSGANSYTGQTTVNSGTLRLDYSTQDNSKLADGAVLVLGNGTLELVGGTHTEVVGSTMLTGNATVVGTPGPASAKLALGDVTGTGTVDFSADSIATTTTLNNAQGILPFATIGGSNLAANDGSGNIVTFTGYVDIDARGPSTVPDNANALVRIVGDGTSGNIDLAASTTTIYNLLQSNANFAATIDTASKTFATNALTVGSSAESLNIGVAVNDGTLRSPDAGGTLTLTSANATKSLTINAVIVDNTSASAVNTAGAGTVVLAGANTHTGSTVVGDGTLQLSGSLTGSAVSVVGDAVLNQTSSGAIAGAVTVTHDSTGASTLAGANSYSGATVINAGSLNIQNAAALGDTTAGTTVASGAALQIQNNITVGTEALTLNGSGVADTGALRNISGTNTYGGLVTLAGPTVISSDTGTLTLSDPGTITGADIPLTVGGAGNTTINSIIGTTSGSLTKQGTGTLTLTGANTFTGGISVTGGVLNLQNDSAAGSTAGGVGVVSGAAIQLQGGITVGNEALNLVGTGVANTGALRNISGDNTWGGLISLSVATRFQSDSGTLIFDVPSGNAIAGTGVATAASNNPPMTFGGNGNFTVKDPITSGSTGAGTLTKEGSGTLTLQASNTYTGATNIDAGTMTISGTGRLGGGNYAGNMGIAGTFNYNSSAAQTLSGVISGSGTFNHNGTGTITVTGLNTFSGLTNINAGTLKLTTAGSGASDITVATGASAGTLVAADNGQFINTGDLTLQDNSTLFIDYGSTTPSITLAPIAVDNLNLGTGLSMLFAGSGVPSLAVNQAYPLVTWTTSGPADGTAFTAVLTHRLQGTFSVIGNTLYFTVTANAAGQPISWNTGNGDWDTVTNNWIDGSLTPTAYVNPLDAVLFDDAIGVTGNPVITLNSNYSPVSVTMNSTGHDYTISGTGSIGGTGGLSLDAANTRTLALGTDNTYTGATAVNGGTLQLGLGGTGGSLNTASAISVAVGATFAVNQSDTVTQGVEFSTAALGGAGGFAQAGSGTTVLNAVNTYTGPTAISGGILEIAGTGQLGGGNYAGNINLSGGGTLLLSSSAAQTLSGLIGGAGSLVKSGGTLTISNANSFTGTTTLNTGTLILNNATALGGNTPGVNGTSSILMAAGTTLRSDYIIADAGNIDSFVYAPIALSGTGSVNFHTGAGSSTAPAEAVTFNLNGAISGAPGTDVVFSTTSGSLNNADSIFVLGAASTYNGNTTITVGNTANRINVKAGVANALPTSTVLNLGTIAGSGTGRTTQYDLNGNDQTLAGLDNGGNVPLLRRQIVTNSSGILKTLTINNANDYTFGGANTNGTSITRAQITGNLALVKNGAGKLTLGGNLLNGATAAGNTYTGNTTVNEGILSIGVVNPSNESSTVTIAETGATLDLTFAGTDIVDKLFIGATQKVNGVYGAVDSGAQFEIPQITGTGTLTVSSGPAAGYASWALLNGAGPNLGDDHDGDGVSNGVEYFIGGPNGNTTGFTPLPGVVNTGGTLSVTWPKAADYTGVYGTDYVVETSATLSNPWTAQAADPDLGFTVTFPSATEVKFTFPAGTKNFARLKVTGP